MSRCNLDKDRSSFEVFVGWDPGVGGYFATVVDRSDKEADGAPMIWIPRSLDLDGIIATARPYACDFDPGRLKAALLRDRAEDSERTYDASHL